jgi:FkbM family methyltransferase
MNWFAKIASDAAGIARVCGWPTALRWLACIGARFGAILKTKNLQPADLAMGDGPFQVRRAQASAMLTGTQVFSGIREIWVRDVYLKIDFLSFPPNALVVDLGANLGVFTTMALAQSPNVRVIAVEASNQLLGSLQRSVASNGWSNRLVATRAFIGKFTRTQEAALKQGSDYAEAPILSEAELIARNQIAKIDFLKCDIEGSEFFMLEPGSRLLAMTDRLAIELHGWGGDIELFLTTLKEIGFEIGHLEWARDCCIALCRRPTSCVAVAEPVRAVA